MKRETDTQTGKILTLILFALLAVCILLVLLTGTGVYKRLTNRGQEAYERRTVPLYIATKVRQADCEGAVSSEQRNGIDVLLLKEQIEGIGYVTRIYCYEGIVRELFSAETVAFNPAAGEKIAEAEAVTFSLEDGCLYVAVLQADGTTTEQMLTLRSTGREVGYEK